MARIQLQVCLIAHPRCIELAVLHFYFMEGTLTTSIQFAVVMTLNVPLKLLCCRCRFQTIALFEAVETLGGGV